MTTFQTNRCLTMPECFLLMAGTNATKVVYQTYTHSSKFKAEILPNQIYKFTDVVSGTADLLHRIHFLFPVTNLEIRAGEDVRTFKDFEVSRACSFDPPLNLASPSTITISYQIDEKTFRADMEVPCFANLVRPLYTVETQMLNHDERAALKDSPACLENTSVKFLHSTI